MRVHKNSRELNGPSERTVGNPRLHPRNSGRYLRLPCRMDIRYLVGGVCNPEFRLTTPIFLNHQCRAAQTLSADTK